LPRLKPSLAYSASRPLFVEHPDEPQFHWSKRGSAFLCAFRGSSYAVLARHTVAPHTAEQLRIPVHDGFTEFFSSDYHWQPEGADDCHDVFLLRLTTTGNDGDWLGSRAPIAPETGAAAASAFVPGGGLAVSGYPGVGENEIDYERNTIKNQRFIVEAEYCSSTNRHVHLLKARQSNVINDFGGYSGGLVMARFAEGLVPAGVVITGSAQSSLMRFITFRAFICRWRASQRRSMRPNKRLKLTARVD